MRSAGMRHSGGFKVDFVPARGPQLRCAHEGQHRETQRQLGSRCTVLGGQRPQEFRQVLARHGLMMRLPPGGLERAL